MSINFCWFILSTIVFGEVPSNNIYNNLGSLFRTYNSHVMVPAFLYDLIILPTCLELVLIVKVVQQTNIFYFNMFFPLLHAS